VAVTDTEGRFPDLPAGTYTLRATALNADPLVRTVTLVAGQVLDVGTLDLVRQPAVPVHVVFPAGAATTSPILAIVDVPGSLGDDDIVEFAKRPVGSIEFDGDGRGWLRGLPAGEYDLRLQTSHEPTADFTPLHLLVRDGITTPVEIVLRSK
jgi:hypothetical protein